MDWISLPGLSFVIVTNSAPVVVARLAGARGAWPIDGGLVLRDGQRLLGAHKTWRGLVAGVAAGAILDHGAYENLKRRWADLARERGYAEAELVASRIDVYPAEHAADVALRFESGARYAFGPTTFSQDVLTEALASQFWTSAGTVALALVAYAVHAWRRERRGPALAEVYRQADLPPG